MTGGGATTTCGAISLTGEGMRFGGGGGGFGGSTGRRISTVIADGAFATRRDAVCVTNTPITIAWRATIAAIAGQRMRGFP